MKSAFPSPPSSSRLSWPRRLHWPLPAVLAWVLGWSGWALCTALALPATAAFAVGLALGVAVAWPCATAWRRAIAAGGFPISAMALSIGPQGSSWLWLLPLAVLAVAYPLRAWRDAPFFPTPANALQGLERWVERPARVLDAGCGMGHGLVALQRLWPGAEVHGVEWSPLLARLAAWRCPGARVTRGDMWQCDWAGHDLVYLFQRPESMARAWAKALQDLQPGAWLVSLEFAVPGVRPHACLAAAGPGSACRKVWIYAVPDAESGLNRSDAGPISTARPTKRRRHGAARRPHRAE